MDNEYLLSVLYDMAEHNSRIAAQMIDHFGDPKDPRELPGVLIESFPWPLGAQLRILFVKRSTMHKPGLPRLNQLISTYLSTSQFVAYIFYSQIWDEIQQKRNWDAQDLFALLPENSKGFEGCDFWELALRLYRILHAHQVDLFLDELVPLFEDLGQEGEAYQVIRFLEQVKNNLLGNHAVPEEDLEALCNEVEFCLASLLKQLAFLAKYRLVTVKDIAIFNPKREKPAFAHFLGYLNASDEGLLTQRNKSLPQYVNSHSVLLVKTRDMDEFLNLSPFVIDKNAFEKEGDSPPNIYMLSCRKGDQYSYTFVNHSILQALENPSDQLHTDDDRYEELGNLICRQFNFFQEDLGNLKG